MWLEKRDNLLKVGITQIPNQILKSSDGYRGYAIDLYKKIEKLLGVKFEYVVYPTWGELLEAAKKREVDILFLAQKTEQRLAYFDFTDIILKQHNKILSASKNYTKLGVDDLISKRVALVKGSAIAEYVDVNYPDITVIHSTSEADSLDKLLEGEVDFTIVEPVRTSYYMEKNSIENLYISGSFPYDYKLRIASRRDSSILSIILNKVVEQISDADKKALALKWGYEKELFFDREIFLKLIILFAFIIFLLMYLIFLNRKLKATQKSLSLINETLEQRIVEEVEKNRQKDLAMLNQSRFAQMGQVINMIAHQWKQPLNNVSLIVQTLTIKCKRDSISKDEIENFSKRTQTQVKEMAKTIDDFRDFFKQEKEKTDFSVNEVLESLISIVEPILEKSKICLSVEYLDEVKVNGYSNELTQAILNIIYNAKDALVEKEDTYKALDIRLSRREDRVLLSIQDNAGGIDDSVIDKIFNPYFTTKGENGTGIGLDMARTIIQQHMNGEISVINRDDGACFTIELPVVT
jgi:signal transduction histidine kinase